MEVLPDPGRRPDVAVNLHGRGPQSRRALSRYRPRRLLAYGPDGPQWRDDEHEVARWCRLLAYYGIAAHPDDLLLPLPASRPEWAGAVVLHPGASSGDRCWPVDRFAALAGHLVAAGHRVLLSGDGSERRRCVGVARGAGLAPDAVLAGRTDIAELSALIAHAGLVVCGDTGVAHLATAYGTPSVVLFGPVSPALWGPPPDRSQHVALWHGPAGLARISVDEVIRVVHSAAAAR
jgi:ADP-heptose:LPS heptosyltransferase